jgi:hypothetical protein
MASDDLPREARTAFPERGYTRAGGSGVSRDANSRTSTLGDLTTGWNRPIVGKAPIAADGGTAADGCWCDQGR